jgi:hypothetical protein
VKLRVPLKVRLRRKNWDEALEAGEKAHLRCCPRRPTYAKSTPLLGMSAPASESLTSLEYPKAYQPRPSEDHSVTSDLEEGRALTLECSATKRKLITVLNTIAKRHPPTLQGHSIDTTRSFVY